MLYYFLKKLYRIAINLFTKWLAYFDKNDKIELQSASKKENPNAKLFISCGGFIE